jgi:hypothetical protein
MLWAFVFFLLGFRKLLKLVGKATTWRSAN